MRRPPEIVRAFEFGRVALPSRFDTAPTRERLELAALRAGMRAFETRGRQLYALGVVGVIDLGDLIIEILPKTHQASTSADGMLFLTNLLRFSGVMQGLPVIDARIAGGERTMLEIILAWAARETARNLREGLPRRYAVREEISTAIRGRVELRHLVRRPPGKDFELLIRHAPLSDDNPLSRIFRWLLGAIAKRTRISGTQLMCRRLLQELSVGDQIPTVSDLESLSLQPAELRWRPLIDFALLLLRQESPNPARAGANQAVAVLFTLHDLFEQVLRRIFNDGFTSEGLELRQLKRHLLHEIESGNSLLKLRPDFVISARKNGIKMAVGDAKWKRILAENGDVTLSESDAYQMVTYLTALNADAGFIFCPRFSSDDAQAFQEVSCKLTGTASQLHILGINLPILITAGPQGDKVRARLCDRIAAFLRIAWDNPIDEPSSAHSVAS